VILPWVSRRKAAKWQQEAYREARARARLQVELRLLLLGGRIDNYHPVKGPPRTRFCIDMTEEEFDRLGKEYL